MTCAKKRVLALLVGASGKQYVGENLCLTPVDVCPREPGEGYEKCSSVCHQLHHAEVQAVANAGADARGGSITINYNRACDACLSVLAAAGVASITLNGDLK